MKQSGYSGTGYTGTLTGHDITASAVFTYPIMPRLGAYLQAGLASVSQTYTLSGYGMTSTGSASGINALFGVGVNYRVTRHIGVHAEYRNTGASTNAINTFLVGATYQF
jgi:opacity protein-like surface antigen